MTDSNDLLRHRACMLALDTSTSNMTIALMRGGSVIAEHETEAVRNHSVELLPNIQVLLKEAGLRPSDLTSIAVGQGPGSYTGVRIGVTTAKTFAWSLGIPLYGVSSLKAMALGGLREHTNASGLIDVTRLGTVALDTGMDWSAGICSVDGCEAPAAGGDLSSLVWIIPLMDARRAQAFTALYEAAPLFNGNSSTLSTKKADGIRLMSAWLDELLGMLDAAEDGANRIKVLFVGETELFANEISRFSERLAGRAVDLGTQLHARDIGALALERMGEEGAHSDEVHQFVPNYTQLAEAEVKLLKAAKERK